MTRRRPTGGEGDLLLAEIIENFSEGGVGQTSEAPPLRPSSAVEANSSGHPFGVVSVGCGRVFRKHGVEQSYGLEGSADFGDVAK